MERITRKEFFRLLLGRARPEEPPAAPAFEPQDALWADFPDALLAEEVRRLGLDPGGLDRAAMLAAVRRAMLASATPRTAATDTTPAAGPAAEEAAADS
jgi:hypothetical protein